MVWEGRLTFIWLNADFLPFQELRLLQELCTVRNISWRNRHTKKQWVKKEWKPMLPGQLFLGFQRYFFFNPWKHQSYFLLIHNFNLLIWSLICHSRETEDDFSRVSWFVRAEFAVSQDCSTLCTYKKPAESVWTDTLLCTGRWCFVMNPVRKASRCCEVQFKYCLLEPVL